MAPVGLVLLFLTGVGPLLAWRQVVDRQPLRDQFLWPTLVRDRDRGRHRPGAGRAGLGVGPLLRAVRVRHRHDPPGVLARRAACGARRRARICSPRSSACSRGRGAATAATSSTSASCWPSSASPATRSSASRKCPLAAEPAGRRRPVHRALRQAERDRRRPEADGHRADDRVCATASRSIRCSRRAGSSAITRTNRRPRSRSAGRCPRTCISCWPATSRRRRRRQFKVIVNPLVNWIWLGVGVMLIGTIIALLPERTFAFAASTVPEAAVTTLLVVLADPAREPDGRARAARRVVADRRRRRPSRRSRRTCGARSSACAATAAASAWASALCPVAAAEAGRDREARQGGEDARRGDPVFRRQVRQPGSRWPSRSTAASTASRGSCRTAWAPSASPWSAASRCGGRGGRDSPQPPAPLQAAASPALQQQLDDELRDLD